MDYPKPQSSNSDAPGFIEPKDRWEALIMSLEAGTIAPDEIIMLVCNDEGLLGWLGIRKEIEDKIDGALKTNKVERILNDLTIPEMVRLCDAATIEIRKRAFTA